MHRLLIGAVAVAFGCASDVTIDRDDRPVVTTGVTARILYPGRSTPPPPPQSYEALPPPQTRSPGSAGAQARSGSAGAQGPSGATLGGTSVDKTSHRTIRRDPGFTKVILAPIAVLTWPFRKAWEVVAGDPAPPPPTPVTTPAPAATPAPPSRQQVQAAHEERVVDRMRDELQRGSPPPGQPTWASPRSSASPIEHRPTIAEELAALRTSRDNPGGVPARAPLTRPRAPATDNASADVRDRNGDGRPDQWIYRQQGVPIRELLDDDGDGTPERTTLFDPATGERIRVEEDLDGDGRTDSWEEYRDGEPVRRRADTTGNGSVDSWTFFRAGVAVRHERDTDGDGFRDRTDYYDGGSLRREEEDLDGNGEPDRISYYDAAGKLSRREEDADADGVIDQRSYYEQGRLVRRELLTDAALRSLEEETLHPESGAAEAPLGDG